MATYFTSDIHFGDERIMKLCGRPFQTVKEMDETIVNLWNEKVTSDDTVWILADLVSPENFNAALLNRLHGKIYFLAGNHDVEAHGEIMDRTKIYVFTESLSYFDNSIFPHMKIAGHNIVLFHYPIMEWNGMEKGWIHLYGHIHNKSLPAVEAYYSDKLAFNVSMDVNGYVPMSLSELVEREGKSKLYRSVFGKSIKGLNV